ncbi:MAG: phenylacetic acid degradation operon negative regulatory protein PaaX [Burkholderiales bacterium]|nr:MAG: phenylacetic acid degradation operon negative regulatory protein PaaX [Burkholderiales bacterium]
MTVALDTVQISSKVARIQRHVVLRSNSVLITIYGDAIAPRQQSVWLGSLIKLVSLFGLSARLLRTSAARLTADQWFNAERVGRRSFYGLSDVGLQRVRHADRRIYEFNLPQWDGQWTLVLLDASMKSSVRQHLKRELLWESFGQLAPGIFTHPHVDHNSLREILLATNSEHLVAVLSAKGIEQYSRGPLQAVMHETFKLSSVETAWKQFIKRFEAVSQEIAELSPAEAFFVRTLLIHEYRRVLLRDPNLPEALLPPDWPGVRARRLCEATYRELLAPSEQFLQTHVETMDGALTKTPRAITQRLSKA